MVQRQTREHSSVSSEVRAYRASRSRAHIWCEAERVCAFENVIVNDVGRACGLWHVGRTAGRSDPRICSTSTSSSNSRWARRSCRKMLSFTRTGRTSVIALRRLATRARPPRGRTRDRPAPPGLHRSSVSRLRCGASRVSDLPPARAQHAHTYCDGGASILRRA